MPPRRSRGAAADDAPGSDDSPRTRSAAISSRLAPLQAKHSTAYGSPAPVLPLRETGKYGANLKGATRSIVTAVRKDNKKVKKIQEAVESEASEPPEGAEKEPEHQTSQDQLPNEATRLQRRREEEEAARQRQADEQAARRQAEEARQRQADEQAARRQAEEARQRQAEEQAARQRQAEDQAARQRQVEEQAAQLSEAEDPAAHHATRRRLLQESIARQREMYERADRHREADKQAAQQRQADGIVTRRQRKEAEAAKLEEENRRQREAAELAKLEEESRRQREEAEEKRRRQEQERETSLDPRLGHNNPKLGHHEQEEVQRQSQRARLPRQALRPPRSSSAEQEGSQRYPRSELWEDSSGRRLKTIGKRPVSEVAPTSVPKRAKIGGTPVLNHTDDGRSRRNFSEPPDPLTLTGRSFIEEGNVYKDTKLRTPAQSSVVGDTPSRTNLPARQVIELDADDTVSRMHPSLRDPTLRSGFFAPLPHLPQTTRDSIPTSRLSATKQQETVTTTHSSAADTRPRTLAGMTWAPNNDLTPRWRGRQKEHTVQDTGDEEEEESPSETSSRHRLLEPKDPPHASRRLPKQNSVQSDDNPPEPYSLEWYLHTAKRGSRSFLGPAYSILRWLAYLSLTLIVVRLWYISGSPELKDARITPTVGWHGWTDWKQNIGQFVPYTLRHPLGCITDDEYNALKYFVSSQGDQIARLAGATEVTSLATEKLEGILPQAVWAKQDKAGKLVITQDFWHALKDFIRDESVLTLQASKDGTSDISDLHWSALLKRFKDHGVRGKDRSTDPLKGAVERTISDSWETWLKANRERVSEIIGTSSSQSLPAVAEKKILSEAEKLIQERLSAKGLKDIVVTKDEFVREVEKSLAVYRREVQTELVGLHDKLGDLAEKAVQASKSTGGTKGLSRSEIISLVNDIARKAIGDAQLKAAAKGSIGTNFEAELGRRVNYFALGNGAEIDTVLTSPTYKPSAKPMGSLSWLKSKPQVFQSEKFAALTSWEDAGHCWCAAANRFEGNVAHPAGILSIKLPQSIIPENVVIEHIDPSATLDPQAMPKNIEVWARADEHTRGELALDFMKVQYPDTKPNHPLFKKGFRKIGEFTYEHNSATNGIQVYRISSEFAKMDFMTDQVVIQAVSNHGADHTCFYRVRLYGEPRELDGAKDTRR